MQKEAKTMGDFVAPDRNAPLVRASLRITVALRKNSCRSRGCGWLNTAYSL